MEKAVDELEKAAVGWRHSGEVGRRSTRRHDGEGSRWVATLGHGGDESRQALGRHGERRGDAAERVRLSCGVFFQENEDNMLRLGTCGRRAMIIGPLG